MKKNLATSIRIEKIALVIAVLFLIGMFIGELAEYFRNSDQRRIYQFGKLTGMILVLGAIIGSIPSTILLIKKFKNDLQSNLHWLFITLIPALYFLIALLI